MTEPNDPHTPDGDDDDPIQVDSAADDPSATGEPKRHGAEHLAKHRWEAGKSGNPGGRPKGGGKRAVSVVAQLRKILAETNSKTGTTYAEMVAKALVRTAVKDGKYQHIKEILDRIDGTLVSRLRIEGALDHMLDVARRALEPEAYRTLCLALADAQELGAAAALGDDGEEIDPVDPVPTTH